MYLMKIVLFAFLCCAIAGCAESSFTLSDDSRLPVWFELREGLHRSDVTVTMHYYIDSNGRVAILELRERDGQLIKKITGELVGLQPTRVTGNSSSSGYPLFEVLNADGQTEVLEHKKMEPVFYIVEDRKVLTDLLDVKKTKDD